MKLFRFYVRSHRHTLLAMAVFTAVLAGSFALYRLPLEAVLYPVLLCVVLGLFFLFRGFARTKSRYEAISLLGRQTAEMISAFPKAETPCEEAYLEIARALREEVISEKSASEKAFREMEDYYTTWAHQIKTPIASMKLTLQKEDSPLSRKLSSDLFRTQQYVEMVLAFLRLGSETTDYVFRACDLDSMIRQSVRKFSSDFICKKLSLRCEDTRMTVMTDEKWFSFVLEQLLSNAVKYTFSGGVRIASENGRFLRIEDTGIGIAPEDLPRIFEKGYTGMNGRRDRTASGLGLYLCRRICEKLGIPLRIESETGKGTVVILDLAQESVTAE